MRRHKIRCRITGIDGNAHALIYAKKKTRGFPEIDFLPEDIQDSAFTIQPCDILISSHFIYHFSDEALVQFLNKNLPAVSTAVILSELTRSRLALFLFKYGRFLLPISKLAKADGILAIKRSLTENEWLSILKQAGIGSYRIECVPFFRILLTLFTIRKT
jgi:2-polyprenyl-3-methyl-5-hydroxy-6-metoxy-1,4-benzoquinol methylase